jgi:hypothetical protein
MFDPGPVKQDCRLVGRRERNRHINLIRSQLTRGVRPSSREA